MANSVDPDKTAHYEPSRLFAKVYFLVYRAERVNPKYSDTSLTSTIL